ncbi:hypothetical protein HD806DRAFT_104092 [Xylariaceae sp. AK1471]|nr:hypothetical protein HD806DRAFT_104092 [Xylariaceae sp. AK1471]
MRRAVVSYSESCVLLAPASSASFPPQASIARGRAMPRVSQVFDDECRMRLYVQEKKKPVRAPGMGCIPVSAAVTVIAAGILPAPTSGRLPLFLSWVKKRGRSSRSNSSQHLGVQIELCKADNLKLLGELTREESDDWRSWREAPWLSRPQIRWQRHIIHNTGRDGHAGMHMP